MLKIGSIKIQNPIVLAPMAGVNDIAFRVLCKRFGAGLVYTEMINADALARKIPATLKKAKISEEEKPVAVQLFGANEASLIKAAKMLESNGADIIDFNLGCPDPKVMKQGAGAALLRNKEKMQSIVKALVDSVKIPVTAKIRLGINADKGLETAKILENTGIEAIAVHGRTVKQGYKGKADWNAIKEIKEAVSIPIIGNGDISSYDEAMEKLKEFNGVMIGRAAIGNPFLFGKNAVLIKERFEVLNKYLELTEKYDCFHITTAKMHACCFTRGLKYSANLRKELSKAKGINDLKKIVHEFMDSLQTYDCL